MCVCREIERGNMCREIERECVCVCVYIYTEIERGGVYVEI